jgi:hypothetical protein
MNLQRFVPDFIKRLDHYLLTHYPIIWQSRIHNVFYAVVLTNLLLGGLAMLLPVNIGHRYDLWEWTWTFFVVAVTYLVIWMIHVGRFNIFKLYGKRPIGDEYINFILHMLCVVMIASTMFSFHYVYDQKIRNAVSNTELAQDINTLNLGAPFFPNQESYYRKYNADGIADSDNGLYLYNYHNFDRFGNQRFWTNLENDGLDNSYDRAYETIDEQIMDTTIVEEVADPCTQSKFGLNCYDENKKLFNQKKSRQEQLELITNFIQTAKKYGVSVNVDANTVLNRFNKNENFKFNLDNGEAYNFYDLNYKLENSVGYVISSKTDRVIFYDPDFWHVMWYLCFNLALLFMIYRNVRRRDFILSIVSGIVIMIVSGIILALTRMNSESEIFGFYFMIYLGLVAGASAILFKRSHSWMNAACLNLVAVATPFMPIFYFETRGHRHFTNDSAMADNWEIAGFVIFFLLLQVFFKKLYTTLWALPEK